MTGNRLAAWNAAGELMALVAQGDPTREPFADAPPELAFRIVSVTFEGLETSDNRVIEPGALMGRALPLGLSAMRVNPEFGGHGLAFVCGRLETLSKTSAATWTNPLTGQPYGDGVTAWVAEGHFNDDLDGRWVRDRVEDGSLRYVSVDLAGVESDIEITEVDEEGWPMDWREHYTAGEIVGATVCNGSAFAGCYIELAATTTAEEAPAEVPEAPAETPPEAEAVAAAALAASGVPELTSSSSMNVRIVDPEACEPCRQDAIAAGGGPYAPPAAWFADPELTEATPLTVTDDGRVFGHIAEWGTCHIGFPGECVTPPHSSTEYAGFHQGSLRTAEGDAIAVGHLTIDTGHADLHLDFANAASHYDDTGSRWADVRAGEDAFGIWIAGAVLPEIDEDKLRLASSSSLSGDWRRRGNGLELAAVLSVNVPGFPISRPAAVAASGVPVALVAAGATRTLQQHAKPAETAAAPRDEAYERVMLGLARDTALAKMPPRRSLRQKRDAALAKLRGK